MFLNKIIEKSLIMIVNKIKKHVTNVRSMIVKNKIDSMNQ